MPWATTFVEVLESQQIVRNQPNGILCSNTLPQHLGQQENSWSCCCSGLLLAAGLAACVCGCVYPSSLWATIIFTHGTHQGPQCTCYPHPQAFEVCAPVVWVSLPPNSPQNPCKTPTDGRHVMDGRDDLATAAQQKFFASFCHEMVVVLGWGSIHPFLPYLPVAHSHPTCGGVD